MTNQYNNLQKHVYKGSIEDDNSQEYVNSLFDLIKVKDNKGTLLEFIRDKPPEIQEYLKKRIEELRKWAEPLVICPYCGSYFLSEHDLEKHIKIWHGDEFEDGNR